MPERILIPLDGSKLGESALRYVEELVNKLMPQKKPVITLLQVINPPVHHIPVEGGVVDVFNGSQDIKPAVEQAMDYLNNASAGLRSQGVNVNCKVMVGEDGVSSAVSIIKAEDEIKADLVAMSTHGRRGISRWAFGSVTEKVLSGGRVPVLMVRAKR